MKRIYKYPINLQFSFSIFLPANSKILDIQTQADTIVLCPLVEEANPPEFKNFRCFITGEVSGDFDNLSYIKTTQIGPLVFHFFEVK